MTSIIDDLRAPRIELFGKSVALFDLSVTALAGYLISKELNINPVVGVVSSFAAGYAVHKMLGIKTALNS